MFFLFSFVLHFLLLTLNSHLIDSILHCASHFFICFKFDYYQGSFEVLWKHQPMSGEHDQSYHWNLLSFVLLVLKRCKSPSCWSHWHLKLEPSSWCNMSSRIRRRNSLFLATSSSLLFGDWGRLLRLFSHCCRKFSVVKNLWCKIVSQSVRIVLMQNKSTTFYVA